MDALQFLLGLEITVSQLRGILVDMEQVSGIGYLRQLCFVLSFAFVVSEFNTFCYAMLPCSMVQELLGYIEINLADVVSNRRINHEYQLIDSKNGKVHVELNWLTS